MKTKVAHIYSAHGILVPSENKEVRSGSLNWETVKNRRLNTDKEWGEK